MEAALRMAYSVLTGKDPSDLLLSYEPVRGLQEFKTAEVEVAGKKIKAAVIYGDSGGGTPPVRGTFDLPFCGGDDVSGRLHQRSRPAGTRGHSPQGQLERGQNPVPVPGGQREQIQMFHR